MQIREFAFTRDLDSVLDLWSAAGSGIQLGRSDEPEEIRKKLARDPDLILVAEDKGRLIGAVMGGFDGRRGMVYHLAVAAGERGKGIGRALMAELERRLQAKIAKYRAAGQPVLLEDFATAPVPDEDNAAHYLTLAATAISSSADAIRLQETIADPAERRTRLPEMQQLVEQNAEALRLVRVARDKAAADWKCPLRSPLIALKLSNLSPQRNVSRLVCVAALYEHERDNDAEAVERLLDALALGRHTESTGPVLIVHLVRIGQDGLAVGAVENIAYELHVADGEPQAAESGLRPAPRDRVRDLIRALLDEQDLQQRGRWSVYGERTMELDSVLWTVGARFSLGPSAPAPAAGQLGSMFPPAFIALWGPAFQLDALRMMRSTTSVADAFAARDYPAARALMPSELTRAYAPQVWARLLSWILLPSLDRSLTIEFRARAMRRLAATALAMRMYEVDHARLPATPAELVPDYLPAVPEDPFDAQHGPLRYRAAAPGPLLYSVGNSGTDDGGSFTVRSNGAVDMDALDIPFFLIADHPRQRPTSQPSSTPSTVPATGPGFSGSFPGQPASRRS
jgi:GNAT superfamily N-acetyltransferase